MPEWVRAILRWAEIVSPCFVILSVLQPVGFAFRKRRWTLWAWAFGLIVVQAAADVFGAAMLAGLAGLAIEAGSVAFLLRSWRESLRFQAAWLKRFQSEEPVVMQIPFEGRWKALGTGPSVARNHHLAARDQWFATDFVRVGGTSLGSRILAPVDGVVSYVEDGRPDKPARRWIQKDLANPAGNYVSLQVEGRENAFVILAHLKEGSITVRAGETVRAGDTIGRCGNSGNTSVPHLHIHAQPAGRFAAGSVWGIPTLFAGRVQWLRPGEIVAGAWRSFHSAQ
jgi:murein DD-endopeptidase MepM/ murein hydrolase activator NlpD